MKAVFITTQTNDVDGVISPWDSFNEPHVRVTFDHMGVVEDERILRKVREASPQVIFYIGSVGPGMPSNDCFRKLRDIAPSIHICFDGVEQAWYHLLDDYRASECFNLQVTIDGAHSAPVDLVTTAPVDPRAFSGAAPERDIKCGCSGNIGLGGPERDTPTDPRAFILYPLMKSKLVTFRQRVVTGGAASYPEHVEFMRRCKMIINTSFAGSGQAHHLKQRVIESAFAGCAILEDAESPIAKWFPKDCYFLYRDSWRAAERIKSLTDAEIAESARQREAYARKHYTPQKVYGEMISRAGLA